MKSQKKLGLIVGLAFTVLFAATPGAFAQSCCDKAAEAGKTCQHSCCLAHYALGKICFKCNPTKATTCCDKSEVAGGVCNHPCCVAATAVASVCFKCNPGRTAVPFLGKDLNAWQFKGDKNKSKWTVGVAALSPEKPEAVVTKEGQGEMINFSVERADSVDIYSKAKFGDCRIEVEVMVPRGANSGIYVMGEYQIQIYDSWGKEEITYSNMGSIYRHTPPAVNASKKPGEWQKFVIDFRAPRFDAEGKKTANAKFVQVVLNDKVLHKNVEVQGPTVGPSGEPNGLTGKEAALGPILFQGNIGPVAYRNIRITDQSNAS